MRSPLPVTIPLLNPNEPEAQLAALHVQEGQKILHDELICTLETTKSTAEVRAEQAGFVVGLRFQAGELVRAGDVLCYLAETADWQPPQIESAEQAQPAPLPENLRISQPALELAQRHQIDLSQFSTNTLVTTTMVQALIEAALPTGSSPARYGFNPAAILIYGAGGHGKSLVELIRQLGSYQIAAFIDDGLEPGTHVMGVPVLGDSQALPGLYERGIRLAVNAVGGIGNLQARLQVFERLAASGFACPALVHPRAFIEPSASLSAGVQVFAHAYVGSEARLGFGTIVNTGAIVSHDCSLADYVNISPGAILAGEVQVGSGALVGMGVTINLRVKIGAGARLGNGATVKSDVPANGVVRAGAIWPA